MCVCELFACKNVVETDHKFNVTIGILNQIDCVIVKFYHTAVD